MDFLDPKKKRAHAIRLMIGYVLVAIALILATTLLLFAALGYGINRTTGEVTQNGLVFVDAHPEQAKILLNGQDRGQTDGRFVLETGNYSIELQRDGYRGWKRDFVVNGGSIVRLVYPFLFPSNLESKDILTATTTTPDVVTESPDRHWAITHYPDALPTFQVVDTSTKLNVSVPITVPTAIFGTHKGAQTLEFTEWSTDNKHLLLKHLYEGGYDYLLIDREAPEKSINIAQALGRTSTRVTLRDKQADQLYTLDANGGVLQAVNLKDKSATTVADGVLEYWPYKENIAIYTTAKDASAGKVNVRIKDGSNNYLLREIVVGPKYLLNVAEFDGDMYLIAGSSADGKAYMYRNPLTAFKKNDPSLNIPLLLLKLDNPDSVTFSANARFVALQAGSKFEVYDAEVKQQYRYDMQLPLDTGQKVNWMDGHRMMLVSKGKMEVFDFDGLNRQTLVSTSPAFIPMFDRDFTAMFTYGPSAGTDPTKSSLVRTELKVIKK
jgi:hypothetical protein